MPRKPRFQVPGIPQHIVQRGNNRNPCFRRNGDYLSYKSCLLEASMKNSVSIHAYVLMTNHVHILATPSHAHSLSHMMQDIGRKYVRQFNRSYNRSGTLWEGRFKASLVDTEKYLLACMRYIELNPVRAGMVRRPDEYFWSSYHFNALGLADELVSAHDQYLSLETSRRSSAEVYRELFGSMMDSSVIDDFRVSLNKELVMGSAEFKNKIEQETKRQTTPRTRGRPCVEENQQNYRIDEYISEKCDLTPIK